MEKQRKNKRRLKDNTKRNLQSFSSSNLSHNDLKKMWIIISVVLIIVFISLIAFTVMMLSGRIETSFAPNFANNRLGPDDHLGSLKNLEIVDEYLEKYDDFNYSELFEKQTEKPLEGEEIVEIKFVGSNSIVKAKLFAEEAPEIVKQFKELVNSGYYNKKQVAGIKGKSLQFLSNDDTKTWDDYSVKSNKVLPYNGALCASTVVKGDGKNSNVNFFIMHMSDKNQEEFVDMNIPFQLIDLFRKNGGSIKYLVQASNRKEYSNMNHHANLLDYLKHPTFGHVFEGKEIIEKLVDSNKRFEIDKIEIVKYKEK